jgi:hypothetical protein
MNGSGGASYHQCSVSIGVDRRAGNVATEIGYWKAGPIVHESMIESITREKQIKAGSRTKKLALIEALNPEWKDLYDQPL